MSKKSGLRETDCEYPTHLQMWQEIDACNKGAKAVLALVSDEPAIVYANTCNGMNFSHLDEEGQLAATNHINNRNLANIQRRKEYWSRGRFFNAVGKTVESFHGMIHNYPATANLSTQMEIIAEDITGSNQSLSEFEKKVTYQLILNGRFAGLSDMKPSNRQLTKAEQESKEFRPRIIEYKAKDILRVVVMNGTVVDVRLNEPTTIQVEDDYECVNYTRRLMLINGVYVNRLYDENDELIEETTPRANGKVLQEIPLVIYGSDANTSEYSKPPMFDLSHINLGHFRLDCDNRDNLYYHGQGQTNVFTDMQGYEFDAMNPAGLDTGAKGKNMFKASDKVELLQIEATGAIPAEMLRDQDRMIQAGAQLIQPNGSAMTLGQKKIETGSSLSTLGRISHNASSGIEKQLEYLAMFAGAPIGDTYKVNSKFVTDDMTPELLNVHLALVQGGVLPQTTLNDSARQAGLTKLDNDQIADELMKDNESLTGISEKEAALQAEVDALREQLANQE